MCPPQAFHSEHEVKNYPMKERTEREEEELRRVENMRKLENAACTVSNTAKRSICDELDDMLTVFNVKQIDSMQTTHALSSAFSVAMQPPQYVGFHSLEIHFIAKPFKSKQVYSWKII